MTGASKGRRSRPRPRPSTGSLRRPGPQSFDLSLNYFSGVEQEAEFGEANCVAAAVVGGIVDVVDVVAVAVVDYEDDIAAVVAVSVDGTAVAEDDIAVFVVQIAVAANTVAAVEETAALAVL